MHETSDNLLKKTLKFTSTKYILKARRDRKHFTRNNHLANRYLILLFFFSNICLYDDFPFSSLRDDGS